MNNYQEHFKKMKSNSHPVRIKNEKKMRRSDNRSTKTMTAGCFMALALCMSMYGYLYPDIITDIASHVGVFSVSQAKDTAAIAETKAPKAEEIAEVKDAQKIEKVKKADSEVSDNANYIQHLEERKKTLDEKEQQLKVLEEKLHQEKIALEKKVEELELKRRDISSKLEGRVQQDEESVKKLVDVYSNMKPQSAAQVIATLDDELAIHILKRMKKQDAGNILNFMSPQKAKALSEKYTGY